MCLIKNEIAQLIEYHGHTVQNPDWIPDADVTIPVRVQPYHHQQPSQGVVRGR
jgi:hypothetical protein